MDLDVAAVRAFVAVVEERSFGHAADRLGVSQQAVSKRVAKLEDRLGTLLIVRGRGGADPTSTGRALLDSARALVGLSDRMAALAGERLATLRVDVHHTWLASIDLARDFHETVPSTGLSIVSSGGLAAGLPALLAGDTDALFGRATGLPDGVRRVPALLEPLQILVRRDHRFAGRERLPLSALAGTTAWMPGIREDSEWAWFYRALGDEFGIGFDTSGPDFGLEGLVERIASEPSRYTFVGEGTRLPSHPDVVRVSFTDPAPVYPWSLMWHELDRHPALPLLVAHIEDAYVPWDQDRYWIPSEDRADFASANTAKTATSAHTPFQPKRAKACAPNQEPRLPPR